MRKLGQKEEIGGKMVKMEGKKWRKLGKIGENGGKKEEICEN